MAVVHLSPEDRERYLLRTFQAAFHALVEFAAKHPARAANVYASIAAHVRSAAPMALLDTGPVVLQAPAVVDVARPLPDGASYAMGVTDGALWLRVCDPVEQAVAVIALDAAAARAFADDVVAQMGRLA